MIKINKEFKNFLDRIKDANLEVFGTDEKLNYRIVHRERLKKAKLGDRPLD